MDGDNLVRMANRIGDFFAAVPDRDEALRGIAQHVARYWAPRMRQQIYGLVDGARADDLQPIVADALRTHREALWPADRDPLPVPPPGQSEA